MGGQIGHSIRKTPKPREGQSRRQLKVGDRRGVQAGPYCLLAGEGRGLASSGKGR